MCHNDLVVEADTPEQRDPYWYWVMTSTSPVKSYFGKSYHFPLSKPQNQRENYIREKTPELPLPRELWIVIMQKRQNCSTMVIELEGRKHLKQAFYIIHPSVKILVGVDTCGDRPGSLREIKIKTQSHFNQEVKHICSSWAVSADIWRRQRRKHSCQFSASYE